MEIIMVVFTESPIFSLAPGTSLDARSWATVGIIAAAMALAKAMGILEIVSAWALKIPQRAFSATSSTSRRDGSRFRYMLLFTVPLRLYTAVLRINGVTTRVIIFRISP